MSQRVAAEKLGITQSTLNKLLKLRNKIQRILFKNQNANIEKKEKKKNVFIDWFEVACDKNAPLNGVHS